MERVLGRVARRRTVCWLGAGVLILVLRASLLPFWQIPKPVMWDEFAYLLQADTFASGRLTNPAHPMWEFFESPYILHKPTYNAKYPPGQGLLLGLGQSIFGHPWYGVWIGCAILLSAICWCLQGWLPPGWALLGTLFAFPVCAFGYWIESYWGGALAATGGALVLGAYPRIARGKPLYAMVLGAGLVILACTRMYEGLLFVVPVMVALLLRRTSLKMLASAAIVVLLGAAFLLVYNKSVTGNALTLPYQEYQRQYGYVPNFNFLPLNPAITYEREYVGRMHLGWEFRKWQSSRTLQLIPDRAKEWYQATTTFVRGIPLLLVAIVLLPVTLRDRRMRLPAAAVVAVVAGSFLQIVYYAHYAAPAAAAIVLIATQSFRHLRHLKMLKGGGVWLCRMIPLATLLFILGQEGLRIYRNQPLIQQHAPNARREYIEADLERSPKPLHLIIVRYTGKQDPHEEWVYNRANIDAQAVVWAHRVNDAEDRRLVEYYKGRTAWLYDPDRDPTRLIPWAEGWPPDPIE